MRAVGPHSLHSPFLFSLYNDVIRPAKEMNDPGYFSLRKKLQTDHRTIDMVDMKTGRSERRTVSAIAKTSLSTPKFSFFLRLLCQHLHAKTVMETGTSLGLNAGSLAKAKGIENVVTLEGSEVMSQLATETLRDTGVQQMRGDIHDILEANLVRFQPDVLFLDADHRGTAVHFCVDAAMRLVPTLKCIVVHDIYWSQDMLDCWKALKSNPRFPLTVDIFQAGLIFPQLTMEKQHVTLTF
jgi:predicted O-methyltransferase YrrM